jgi:hypothetical protein
MNIPGTDKRFDPAICGKAIWIAAAVCVMEFLTTIALLMMWVPADSKCRAWAAPSGAPDPIYALIAPVGLLTLWTCILAVSWKHFANFVVAQLRWEERQRASTGWLPALYRSLQPFQVNYTALFAVGSLSFAAIVAIPLVIILRRCGP